jgi:hypothetical protein
LAASDALLCWACVHVVLLVQTRCNVFHYMVRHEVFLPAMEELLAAAHPFDARFAQLLEARNTAGVWPVVQMRRVCLGRAARHHVDVARRTRLSA